MVQIYYEIQFICCKNVWCFLLYLCRSESPSQIYMQVVRLLYLEFKDVPQHKLEDTIKNYVLCYDNMCQLDSLKASKEDLPFPPPLNTMWRDIQKIIDRLHLQNHKQDKCKELYNPDKVLPEGYNTMVAEQTFAWFSRFKKIANSMSQTHHLFYIHRNIKRRNAYSSRCRQRGKEQLLPGINTNLSKNWNDLSIASCALNLVVCIWCNISEHSMNCDSKDEYCVPLKKNSKNLWIHMLCVTNSELILQWLFFWTLQCILEYQNDKYYM